MNAKYMAGNDNIRVVAVPNEDKPGNWIYVVEKMSGHDALGAERWELRNSIPAYDLQPLFEAIFEDPDANLPPF